jgi:hypothetical protein
MPHGAMFDQQAITSRPPVIFNFSIKDVLEGGPQNKKKLGSAKSKTNPALF